MRNLNPDNSFLPSLPCFNSSDENVKMQSLKHILIYFSIYFKRKKRYDKSPHDHVPGGVPGLNTPSLKSRQMARKVKLGRKYACQESG